MVETSDEWIRERTGIGSRHVSEEDNIATLAAKACKEALSDAGKKPEDVDLILVATCSPDYLLPCCACRVQSEIGAVKAVCFDVNAACSGFLFALETAYAYINSGLYKNALVVGSDGAQGMVLSCNRYEDGMSMEDIDMFVLHQANARILEAVGKRLGVSMDKIPSNVERVGNTSSAAIPLLLDELNKSGKIVNGQKLVLSGFGAGLTYGACVMTWNK